MTDKKNTNGQEDGAENVKKVKGWIDERNRLRDWDDYKYRGRIKRSGLNSIAEDLGYAASVNTQNPGVRKLLEDQDKIWFNYSEDDKESTIASQEASIERTQRKLRSESSNNSNLHGRVAELEAENRDLLKDKPASEYRKLKEKVDELEAQNRELRQKLSSHERIQNLLENGEPGFRV